MSQISNLVLIAFERFAAIAAGTIDVKASLNRSSFTRRVASFLNFEESELSRWAQLN